MKIYDPVHGFIHFDSLEGELIDLFAFQRLRHIRQLGVAYLVYPGATHTRFEHSLGTMHLASQIFDRLGLEDSAYWRKIVRLAALCHDLGHLPFSHVAEKMVLGEEGHERWTLAVIQSQEMQPLWKKVSSLRDVAQDVAKIALGEKKAHELGLEWCFSQEERIVSQTITGDFFGADRIDYLLRDARCTGVSYGLFDYHQLIETVCTISGEIGILENGIESCEALLLARHFMHRRVYQYPSVKSYGFHMARFIATILKATDLESYLSWTDNEVLAEAARALRDPSHPGHDDAVCLFDRKKRVRAIPTEIQVYRGLSFPVKRKNGSVTAAGEISGLTIPSGSISWEYVQECLNPV